MTKSQTSHDQKKLGTSHKKVTMNKSSKPRTCYGEVISKSQQQVTNKL